MAFTDNKITQADLNGKGVTGLPDAPELSTKAMQKKFDELSTDVIVPKFNELCETLDANVPPIILPEAPITPQDGDMLVYDSEVGAFVFVQKATTLANLKDVDMTGLVNGMYLRYDFPTRSWKATNSSASVPALDDINDVTITSATTGQCLVYNNGTWVNDNEKLDDLKNVYIHLPQNKQFLAYDSVNDRWTNVDLDGGGHKILNASGTQLAQEEYLQFGGLLKVTDESGKTVVTDEAEDISFADWDALTEAQKEAYSAGKKLNILDPPDCDGEVEVELMKLAWTNPNPTSAFASQTITLDTDGDWDFVDITPQVTSGSTRKTNTLRLQKNDYGWLEHGRPSSSGVVEVQRMCQVLSDTQVTFSDALYSQNAQASTTDNTFLIPINIYVGKYKTTAKINAIATNVKATVDYSTSEHKIGKWIDGSDLYEKTVDIGTMPNATYKSTNHGVSNMGSVVSVIGTMIRTTDNICKPLPFGLTSSSNFVSVEVTPSVVYVTTGTDYSTYKGYITIRYTKTS